MKILCRLLGHKRATAQNSMSMGNEKIIDIIESCPRCGTLLEATSVHIDLTPKKPIMETPDGEIWASEIGTVPSQEYKS